MAVNPEQNLTISSRDIDIVVSILHAEGVRLARELVERIILEERAQTLKGSDKEAFETLVRLTSLEKTNEEDLAKSEAVAKVISHLLALKPEGTK